MKPQSVFTSHLVFPTLALIGVMSWIALSNNLPKRTSGSATGMNTPTKAPANHLAKSRKSASPSATPVMGEFYKYWIVAKTGQSVSSQGTTLGTLVKLGKGVSLNDNNKVAFSGTASTPSGLREGIFVGDSSGEVKYITEELPGGTPITDRRFGSAVQINNENRVLGYDEIYNRTTGTVTQAFLRKWDYDNPNQDVLTDTVGCYGFSQCTYTSSLSKYAGFNNYRNAVFIADDKLRWSFNLAGVSVSQDSQPLISDNGQVVTWGPGLVIRLYDQDVNTPFDVAAGGHFSRLGRSPGISDDGKIITFYGELTPDGADALNDRQANLTYSGLVDLILTPLTPGKGIFASIKTDAVRPGGEPIGRVIQRIAGIGSNGFLDPGELYNDVNNNGKHDKGETDIGPFTDFSCADFINYRVGVNSTHQTQRAVTIAYIASYDNALVDSACNNPPQYKDCDGQPMTKLMKRGLYTNHLNFYNATTAPFEVNLAGGITVSRPTPVIKFGDTITGLNGYIEDLSIYDPVNNRDRGDVAFWVRTSSCEEAIILARPMEVVYLDFDPVSTYSAYVRLNQPNTESIFTDYYGLVEKAQRWFASMNTYLNKSCKDVNKPETCRWDIRAAVAQGIIQNSIVTKVQEAFDNLDPNIPGLSVNVKVRGYVWQGPPTDGPYTHVFIGDGPHSKNNGQDLGIANIDPFNQNNVGSGEVREFPKTPMIFVDNIFQFYDLGDGLGLRTHFTDGGTSRLNCQLISISLFDYITLDHMGENKIEVDDIINAIANTTAHEVGHSLGLDHVNGNLHCSIMASGTKDDSERFTRYFFNSPEQFNPKEFNGFITKQNSAARLAFAVGSDLDPPVDNEPNLLRLSRDAPSLEIQNHRFRPLVRTSASQGANRLTPLTPNGLSSLNSIQVVRAAIGIVPLGIEDSMPEFIDLGSGDLWTLLDREIKVGRSDKVFIAATTTGRNIDIFSVARGFTGNVGQIDLANAILLMTDKQIRGDLFDVTGQPMLTALDLYQSTASGPVKLGTFGARSATNADLSITKTVSPNPITAGSQLTYNLTVTNLGPHPATGVTITDQLPSGITFVSAISSRGTCTQQSGTVTCIIGNLSATAPNNIVTVTIVVIPTAARPSFNIGRIIEKGFDEIGEIDWLRDPLRSIRKLTSWSPGQAHSPPGS